MFVRIAAGTSIVLEEPTVVAIAVDEQKIVSVGEEAQNMLGRVPESIEVAQPMVNGVIADYEITEKLLEYLIRKVSSSSRFFRPKVMITVPFGVTSVESRAVHEAILQAGTREAYLIQQPLAAALGMDLPIGTPSGNMVLCMGAGTTQAAVIAMYLVAFISYRILRGLVQFCLIRAGRIKGCRIMGEESSTNDLVGFNKYSKIITMCKTCTRRLLRVI